jgi:hypothetical protein
MGAGWKMTSETGLRSESGAKRRCVGGRMMRRSGVPNQGNREWDNVQNSKLPRLEAEDGEEGEADDKESEGGQVEAAKEEEAVPATYCRPGSARFLRMKSSASRVESPG